jgi:hypothetical protein
MHGSMSAAGGNQTSRASTRRTVQASRRPYLDSRAGSLGWVGGANQSSGSAVVPDRVVPGRPDRAPPSASFARRRGQSTRGPKAACAGTGTPRRRISSKLIKGGASRLAEKCAELGVTIFSFRLAFRILVVHCRQGPTVARFFALVQTVNGALQHKGSTFALPMLCSVGRPASTRARGRMMHR